MYTLQFNAAPGLSPEGVTVDVQDARTFNVSWSLPRSQQNGVLRSYTVSLTDAASEMVHQYRSNSTSIMIRELVPYSTYSIRVAAVTVATGPLSEIVYADTPEAGEERWLFIAGLDIGTVKPV